MYAEALSFLREIAGLPPAEATERLSALRAKWPEAKLRLLWQVEAYDDSLHYDLLVREPERGTVSLAWSPPGGGLPWPLRGVHRAAEGMLLRVNGVAMPVADAVARLDFIWDEARLAGRLVDTCLIQAELDEEPVEIGEEDLDAAVDAWRRARGLVSARAAQSWLEHNAMTLPSLRELVLAELRVSRLRERVTAHLVEEYFAGHRADFDVLRVARLRATGEIPPSEGFAAALERLGGDVVEVTRDEVPGELFTAAPGTVAGPVGGTVYKVIEARAAVLDDATRTRVSRLLFRRWLDERRAEAKVEWFWGSAARTGS